MATQHQIQDSNSPNYSSIDPPKRGETNNVGSRDSSQGGIGQFLPSLLGGSINALLELLSIDTEISSAYAELYQKQLGAQKDISMSLNEFCKDLGVKQLWEGVAIGVGTIVGGTVACVVGGNFLRKAPEVKPLDKTIEGATKFRDELRTPKDISGIGASSKPAKIPEIEPKSVAEPTDPKTTSKPVEKHKSTKDADAGTTTSEAGKLEEKTEADATTSETGKPEEKTEADSAAPKTEESAEKTDTETTSKGRRERTPEDEAEFNRLKDLREFRDGMANDVRMDDREELAKHYDKRLTKLEEERHQQNTAWASKGNSWTTTAGAGNSILSGSGNGIATILTKREQAAIEGAKNVTQAAHGAGEGTVNAMKGAVEAHANQVNNVTQSWAAVSRASGGSN